MATKKRQRGDLGVVTLIVIVSIAIAFGMNRTLEERTIDRMRVPQTQQELNKMYHRELATQQEPRAQ